MKGIVNCENLGLTNETCQVLNVEVIQDERGDEKQQQTEAQIIADRVVSRSAPEIEKESAVARGKKERVSEPVIDCDYFSSTVLSIQK